MQRFATRNRKRFLEQFERSALEASYWGVANSGGAGASNFAPSVARNGYGLGATGTTDDGSISMIGPIIYAPVDNLSLECRLQLDIITNVDFEFGLIDAVPAANGGGVNNSDTPTTNFSNGAVVMMDQDSAGVTQGGLQLISNGNGSGQVAVAKVITAPTTPVPATWMTFRLDTFGTNGIRLAINGVVVATTPNAFGGTNGTVLLAPWFYCRTRNTTAKNPRIQYVAMVHDNDG
jgi:hypothetical protein